MDDNPEFDCILMDLHMPVGEYIFFSFLSFFDDIFLNFVADQLMEKVPLV